MHAVGLQSALAIRRQRKRREEQKRAKERRYSLQSSESGLTSPHGSHGSLDRAGSRRRFKKRTSGDNMLDTKVVSSLGMLHLGVVFVVLGLFLIGSGILPDDVTKWSTLANLGWWNELVCTGIFALGLGVFLIVLNKYISKKEEDDLEEYVQRQLTRSRSGHRLERDVETGGMLTKHTKRERSKQKEDEERGLTGTTSLVETPPLTPKSPTDGSVAPTHHGFMNPVATNGDVPREHHLDQIIEEEYAMTDKGEDDSARMEYFNKETYSSYPREEYNDTDARELVSNGRHLVLSNM